MDTTFTLTIRLGNAAMQTGEDIADALRNAADKLADGYGMDYLDEWTGLGAAVYDANGNKVGRWGIEQEVEK